VCIFLIIRKDDKELEKFMFNNAKLSSKIATRLIWLLNVGKNSLNENDTIDLEFYDYILAKFNVEIMV
jgi:hypothetical protein